MGSRAYSDATDNGPSRMNWPSNQGSNYPQHPQPGSAYPGPQHQVGYGGPGRSPPTKKVKPWTIAVGALLWLVVCGVVVGDVKPKNKNGEQDPDKSEAGTGFTTRECEEAVGHVAELVGGVGFGAELRSECDSASEWVAKKADSYRCAAAAETVAEVQLCGDRGLATAVADALEGAGRDFAKSAEAYPGVYDDKGNYVTDECTDFELRVARIVKDELFRDDTVPEEKAMGAAARRVRLPVQVTSDAWAKIAMSCAHRL